MVEINASDDFQRLVEQNGDTVLMHTATCEMWKLEHGNCKGCPSEIGCAKVVCMMGITLTPILYSPISYEDFEGMHNAMQIKLDKLLKSKTIDEVHAINW